MTRKIIIIILILVSVSMGGILLWRDNQSSLSTTPPQKENSQELESDHSLESTVGGSPSFIEDLRRREFKGGEIKIEETAAEDETYTSYIISYPSDNLKIYGMINIPKGNGPFPIIVLNHGYYNPSEFKSGDGTKNFADTLAHQGYITVASDYRGHGNSDNDNGSRGGHRPEYTIDVLNLIASIPSISKANKDKIGMWGHSMGGEVSLRAIEATDKIKAVALWAPTSGNAADNHAFYSGNDSPTADPALEGVSPNNYLKYITAPISIHQGLEDIEVKPEWSKELRDALEKENKTVEYFEYVGQDHNFRSLGWDEVSKKTLAFYERYLKNE